MDLLRHLTFFFVAVAEEAHFGRAADRLDMTQPPVSQGIQRLERKLGLTLLSRGTGGVHLTPAGTELLPHARALLNDAARFDEHARHYGENRGVLRIGVIPELSDNWVAAIVAGTRQAAHGSRTVVVTTASTVDLVDAVTAGRLDCALVHHPALVTNLGCGAVHRLRRWFLVPADNAVDGLKSLQGLPFATAPRSFGTAAFDQLVDALRAAGLDPDFLPAGNDRETLAAVAAGRAFGFTVDPRLELPAVSRLPADDFPLRVRLVWREPGPAREVVSAIESCLGADQ